MAIDWEHRTRIEKNRILTALVEAFSISISKACVTFWNEWISM